MADCAHFDAQMVRDAYERIKGKVYETPLNESVYLSDPDWRCYFKLENQQRGKSFKLRGALSKMLTLSPEQLAHGVGTVSSGNHGIAVSYAARQMGVDSCMVVVPVSTEQVKVDRIRHNGARVMTMGANYDEAMTLGRNYIDRNEMAFIDPSWNDPLVYAGQGTIGLEILEQNPDIDTIVVPIGGGGLITGIAMAAKSVKPDVRIVGVQTEACPAMAQAFKDHVLYERYPTTGETICDALVGGIGKIAYHYLPDLLDEMIVVSEASIRRAMAFMVAKEQILIEGGSAVVVAAVDEYPELVGGSNVCLVLSGGNVNGRVLEQVLRENKELLE